MMFQTTMPTDWVVEAEGWQWALLICSAALVAVILYGWRSGTHRTATGNGLTPISRLFLGALRFLVVAGLGFLLLEPLIKKESFEKELPVTILLVDESASVLNRMDSANSSQSTHEWCQAFESGIQKREMAIESYGFANELLPKYTLTDTSWKWQGTQTNLDRAVRELTNRIENRNIAGILLISDGLVNRGAAPDYGINWPNLPIWTVGLGDTTTVRDRWVANVNHNRVAYLGNTFPVEVFVESQGFENASGSLEIKSNGRRIASEKWTHTTDRDILKFSFQLEATQVGTQRFDIEILAAEKEYDVTNNRKRFYVEVKESRRLITLISEFPHPDVGSIRTAIKGLDGFEVQSFNLSSLRDANSLNAAIEKSDVILAHNILGSRFGGKSWVDWFATFEKPVWWIAGTKDTWEFLQAPNDLGVELSNKGDLTQSHKARFNSNFSTLEFPPELGSTVAQWPPFTGPFEDSKWSAAWSPLLFRQLGSIETQDVFWGVQTPASGNRRILTIGEGIWRWKMSQFRADGSHQQFNEFIQRQVQFLAAKDSRKRLLVESDRRIATDERLFIKGEAYDAAWNPISNIEIEVTLTDEQGQDFKQTMLVSNTGYAADFGKMPEGTYQWQAQCTIDGINFEENGLVIVENRQIEHTNLAADHGLLARISDRSAGKFLGDMAGLTPKEVIDAMYPNENPQTILHAQTTLRDLVDWWQWLLGLLILLSVEWTIRRRNLGY